MVSSVSGCAQCQAQEGRSWHLLRFRHCQELNSGVGLAQTRDSYFVFRSCCLRTPLLLRPRCEFHLVLPLSVPESKSPASRRWLGCADGTSPARGFCQGWGCGEVCRCLVSAIRSRAGLGLALGGGLFT